MQYYFKMDKQNLLAIYEGSKTIEIVRILKDEVGKWSYKSTRFFAKSIPVTEPNIEHCSVEKELLIYGKPTSYNVMRIAHNTKKDDFCEYPITSPRLISELTSLRHQVYTLHQEITKLRKKSFDMENENLFNKAMVGFMETSQRVRSAGFTPTEQGLTPYSSPFRRFGNPPNMY